MASAEHEPIAGSCQGGGWAKPPWSWKHIGYWMSNGAGKKFGTSSWKQYVWLRSTGVRVGGAQSAWRPPQPRHWGGGAPPRPSGSAAYGRCIPMDLFEISVERPTSNVERWTSLTNVAWWIGHIIVIFRARARCFRQNVQNQPRDRVTDVRWQCTLHRVSGTTSY